MTSFDDVYFLNNYGRCRLGEECECLKGLRFDGQWGGLMCDDWMPLGVRSMEELKLLVLGRRVSGENECGND